MAASRMPPSEPARAASLKSPEQQKGPSSAPKSSSDLLKERHTKAFRNKMQAQKEMLKKLVADVGATAYGRYLDTPLSPASVSLRIIAIIGGESSPWNFGHPSAVSMLSVLDQYQCGCLDRNLPGNYSADMSVVDLANHHVQRFSIVATKYIRVPMDAVETDDPCDISDEASRRADALNQPLYTQRGLSVAEAWHNRWAQLTNNNELKNAKLEELKKRTDQRKSVWVRCRMSKHKPHAHANLFHNMVITEKPEIIVNNYDPSAYEYVQAHICGISYESGVARLELTFPGVYDIVFRGFYGAASSDFKGAKFVLSATQIAEIDNAHKMIANGGINSSSGSSTKSADSASRGGKSSDTDKEVALHQIILEEELRFASKIKEESLGSTPSTRGIMPNQFTRPCTCSFTGNGESVIVDNLRRKDASNEGDGCVETTSASRSAFLIGIAAKWTFVSGVAEWYAPIQERDDRPYVLSILVELRNKVQDNSANSPTEDNSEKKKRKEKKTKNERNKKKRLQDVREMRGSSVTTIEYIFADDGSGYFEYRQPAARSDNHEGFGYTPWLEVNCFGVDPNNGLYSVEINSEFDGHEHDNDLRPDVQSSAKKDNVNDNSFWHNLVLQRLSLPTPCMKLELVEILVSWHGEAMNVRLDAEVIIQVNSFAQKV
eukprot:g2673.t1